jgi:hypothetical protein
MLISGCRDRGSVSRAVYLGFAVFAYVFLSASIRNLPQHWQYLISQHCISECNVHKIKGQQINCL